MNMVRLFRERYWYTIWANRTGHESMVAIQPGGHHWVFLLGDSAVPCRRKGQEKERAFTIEMR
jgi:hypothetical protein